MNRTSSSIQEAPAGQSFMRIGIVEDDSHVRSMIERYLAASRFISIPLRSGAEVHDIVAKDGLDMLLLDLGLPGEDGLKILLALRRFSRIPVVIVSGRKETVAIAAGLDAGADDYVTKPIAFEELGARLRSVMRRAEQSQPASVRVRKLTLHGATLDLETRRMSSPLGEVQLTERETLIVTLLQEAGGRPVSRSMLARATMGQSWDLSMRTLDVHVSNLRSKLEKIGIPRSAIQTARNVGYYLSAGALESIEAA